MTAEECFQLALNRAMEFSASVPRNRTVAYRRIGIRQQELFAAAAAANSEWGGVCATAPLDANARADLRDIEDTHGTPEPVPTPEVITRIEVADPGTSELAAGDEIHIVSLDDPDAGLPPRAVLRDRLFAGWRDELAGVAFIRIYYPRVPLPIGPTDGARVLEIPEPHVELLVIDLARDMVRKAVLAPADVRAAAIALLDAEEKACAQAFLAHVTGFAPAEERF